MDLKKIMKNLPTSWAEEAEAMDETQLRDVVIESSNNIRVTKQEMDENPGVTEARDAVKEVTGPFRDAMKAQKAKIDYALYLLESKGKL